MTTTNPATEGRTVVWFGDTAWLAEPGDYLVRNATRADRARLSRVARKHGLTFRSSWDSGLLYVDLRPAAEAEHGTLFSHASEQVYADLVGPVHATTEARDTQMYGVIHASGVKALRVSRHPGGEWLTRDGLTARQALTDGIARDFRGWL